MRFIKISTARELGKINVESNFVFSTYFDVGYITDSSAVGTAMTMKIRFGHFDGETNNDKFMNYLRPRMNKTVNSQTLTITYSDDNNDNFITAGTIDTQYKGGDLHRLGRFYRRNIELQYSGTEQIFLESLETKIQMGSM